MSLPVLLLALISSALIGLAPVKAMERLFLATDCSEQKPFRAVIAKRSGSDCGTRRFVPM
jgi:hypothetical protein